MPNTTSLEEKWLVVGEETRRGRVSDWLFSMGKTCFKSVAVFRPSEEAIPDVIFLVSPEQSILDEIRSVGILRTSAVVVIHFGEDNFSDLIGLEGWDDMVSFNCPTVFFLKKTNNVTALSRSRQEVLVKNTLQNTLLRMQHTLIKKKGSLQDLRVALQELKNTLGFERASLIAYVPPSKSAYVLAATDDPNGLEFVINVESYPEISEAVLTKAPVHIEDFSTHPLTKNVWDCLKNKDVSSLAVFPVYWQGSIKGVLRFRHSLGRQTLNDEEARWLKIVTPYLGAYINDFEVYERFRVQNDVMTMRAFETEKQLRSLGPLKELFESVADGTVVLSKKGDLLYANHAAYSIFEIKEKDVESHNIMSFVSEDREEWLKELLPRSAGALPLEAFDLQILLDDKEKTVSVTVSNGFEDSGLWLWTVKDVTIQRSLESKLKHTKDFLENLVHSAVDAIVAADRQGTIVLFNGGAERLLGHKACDVVNKKHVSMLYPGNSEKEVMERMRSAEFGGTGKLQQTRRLVLGSSGESIPVSMTAAIIYKGDQEVGTVGIFTDLREQTMLEERLLTAQSRIEEQKRMTMMAELAGATAHELNQPLTSLSLMGELLLKHKSVSDEIKPYIESMEKEASKMGNIVKRIGRITKYETVNYVGQASIVDLEHASSPKTPINNS